MLTTRARRRRPNEHGQTLLFGLFFVLFFALVVTSVLRLADVNLTQHLTSETVSSVDSGEDGGAAYAAANSARTSLSQTCTPGVASSLKMTSGDTVGYTVRDCNPGNTSIIANGGGHCLLCILNVTSGAPIAPVCAPVACVLDVTCSQCPAYAIQTTGGDDYINGSVNNTLTLQACATNPGCTSGAHVNLISGAKYPNPCCSPYPPTSFTSTLADPLASIGAPVGAGQPSTCTAYGTWDLTKGCIINNTSNASINLTPGVYNSIKISGNASVTFQTGMYVLTGTLDVSKGIVCAPGTITGGTCTLNRSNTSGVTIYMTCPGSAIVGPYQPCPTTQSSFVSGGAIKISGQADVHLAAMSCAAGDIIPCPSSTYASIAVLADPHLLDVGPGGNGVASCITGSSCDVQISGKGGDFTGSIDTRMAGIAITGNGAQTIADGFLIANSLYLNGSGSTGPGLNLSGPGTLSATGNCGVSDISVYLGAVPPAKVGRAVVQSQCGTNATSGIVDLNYSP